jgi:hypothetical protein
MHFLQCTDTSLHLAMIVSVKHKHTKDNLAHIIQKYFLSLNVASPMALKIQTKGMPDCIGVAYAHKVMMSPYFSQVSRELS